MKLYIARDIDNRLFIFEREPYDTESGHFTNKDGGDYMEINMRMYPWIKHDNSPVEVELVVEGEPRKGGYDALHRY